MENIQQTPVIVPTISPEGVGIHLLYIGKEMSEIKANQKNNSEAVQAAFNDIKNGYVTRIDYDEHLKSDEDHEVRIRTLEQNMWRWIGASSVISAGLFSIIEYFISMHK